MYGIIIVQLCVAKVTMLIYFFENLQAVHMNYVFLKRGELNFVAKLCFLFDKLMRQIAFNVRLCALTLR